MKITSLHIILFFLLTHLIGVQQVCAQVPVNKQADKASRKRLKSLEKEYKKAVKYHKKIQTSSSNKRSRKNARAGKRSRDNKQGIFANRIKGGSLKKGIRRVSNRSRMQVFRQRVQKGMSKMGKSFKKAGDKIGSGFGKVKNIRLPKIKWPRIFKRK